MKQLPTRTSRRKADVAVNRSSRRAGVRLALTGSVTALLLAGCGSSAPSGTGTQSAAASNGVAVAAASNEAVVQSKVVHSKVKVAKADQHYAPAQITRIPKNKNAKGGAVQRPKDGTGGDTTNDDNPAATASRADTGGRPSTSGVPDPCVLVSPAQAHAFTGKAITVTEAPLGPTCIYQEAGVKLPVTMVVERQSFGSLKAHAKKASSFTVARRPAYCGVYSSPVTYVSLSGSRVLSVTAPCSVGAKFAAAALTKLGY